MLAKILATFKVLEFSLNIDFFLDQSPCCFPIPREIITEDLESIKSQWGKLTHTPSIQELSSCNADDLASMQQA